MYHFENFYNIREGCQLRGVGSLQCTVLSEWLSVCIGAYRPISVDARAIFTNFCVCHLSPWSDHPLAALRYVMYFRFYG